MDKSSEFICKNSIFSTNVNSLDTNLKRKRAEENETDDLSNLNPSIYEEEQRENPTVNCKTKITSKGLSSLKTYNESPVKTYHNESQDPNQFRILDRESD